MLIFGWIIFILFFEINKNNILRVIGIFFVASSIFYSVDPNFIYIPTANRLMGIFSSIDKSTNLSSLVYIQGIQDAWINLYRNYGLGLGLNMMGCSPLPNSSAREVLENLNLIGLNAEDGSFLGAKIVSEFGVLGILFLAYLFYIFLKLLKKYKFSTEFLTKQMYLIQATLIYIIIFIFFTRTTGYFGGPFFILIAILGSSYSNFKLKSNNDGIKKEK
jgi:hypothetical protein